MRTTLQRHPDIACDAISRIEVDVERMPNGDLSLRYAAHGSMDGLLIPVKAQAKRTDLLWHHTCFEAFIKPQPGSAYTELNASPSTRWALYSFSSFRAGMTEAPPMIQMSPIQVNLTSDQLALATTIKGLPSEVDWRVALSAIIEEKSGRKSFWALKHPPEKPDFHHDDCFDLQLPAPSRA
ncbi:MAG: hypothetical protein GC190_09080 [Alphaproteobacteria bacterium]|nr:hypothetical protein [Alphaproteobacteria bacterium]